MIVESPFKRYCDQVDLQFMEASASQYYKMAYSIPRPQFQKLIFEDFKFREKYQGNVVVSVEGEQGSGKSIFTGQMALQTSRIFRRIFNWENLTIDIARFNEKVRKGKPRETFWLDEQPKGRIGMMSGAQEFKLAEYEEQCRSLQKNLFYCSPTVRDHSHYFVFETENINRVHNPTCIKCPFFTMELVKDPTDDKEVSKKYCLAHQYKTMCENNPKVPYSFDFTKRHGYPISFLALLKTRSKYTKLLMPRGILELPMLSPVSIKEYNKKKKENLERLDKEQSADWAMFKEVIEKLWEKNSENLVIFHERITSKTIKLKNPDGSDRTEEVVNDNSTWKARSKKFIETLIYDEVGLRKYTKEAVEIISTALQARAEKLAAEKNHEL